MLVGGRYWLDADGWNGGGWMVVGMGCGQLGVGFKWLLGPDDSGGHSSLMLHP